MARTQIATRIVVVAVDPPPIWNLPAATPYRRSSWVGGGQQTLYELAVAAAAAGYEVELRGEIEFAMLDELANAAGARPATPTVERRPDSDDIVVISEGGWDPLRFARLVLSPARVVLAVLAPTGLFGWPFAGRTATPDPMTVALEQLARTEHFAAIAELDIDVWTHMGLVHEVASAAGARSELIGNGSPVAVGGEPAVKDIDVAYLEGSRWRGLAEQAAALMTRPVHAIPSGDRASVLGTIARAKILIWPARIEGHGRVLCEARAVGTVVVGLSSNSYATGLNAESGAIAVDQLEAIPAVVERLLADDRWRGELADAGRRTAAAQVDWPAYVERVGAAIERVQLRAPAPAVQALASFGRRVGDIVAQRDRLVGELAATTSALDETRGQLVEVTAALTAARAQGAGERRIPARLAGLVRRARSHAPAAR
jgi:hypothetical protein